MSLTEKYYWFKRGIVKRNTDEKLQAFFKTEPSTDQLLLLDEIEKTENGLLLIYTILIFVLGLMVGGFVMRMFIEYNLALGLPI